jgi:MFS family permease
MLNDFLSGSKKSRSIAFYTSSFGIGASVSILSTGYLSEITDWQTTFALLSLGPVMAIILTIALVPRIRHDKLSDHAPTTHVLDFRPVIRCRAAMAYVIGYTIHNFELFAVRAWSVAFLAFVATLYPDTVLPLSVITLAALINLLGVPASIIGNEVAVKLGRHRWITLMMLCSAMLSTLVGFSAAWSIWVVIGLSCLHSIAITADSASLTAGAVEAAPPGYLGATMAVHSSIAFTGAFLGPLVFGMVLDMSANATSSSSLPWGIAFATVGVVMFSGPLLMRWVANNGNETN